MKRALRFSCIVLLAVLILTANTVFSVAETEDEAVDMGEVLTILDEKHTAYLDRMMDRVYNSRVSYNAGETVGVYSTSDMGYAYIAWHTMPTSVKITWVDKNRKSVSTQEYKPAGWNEYISVPQEGVCGYTLSFQQSCAISELSAYTPGQLSDELPQFESAIQNPAVMIIVGYPGDELVCFGGLLPSLVHRGVPVQIVYLNPYNRNRQEECLRTLWKLGMRNEPIFINTTGKRSLDGDILKSNWEKDSSVSRELVNIIETYRPAVIVTNGKTRPFPLMAEAETTYTVFTYIYKTLKNFPWLKKVYTAVASGHKDGAVYDFSQDYAQAAALYEEGYASLRTFHYTPCQDDTYILYHTNVGRDTAGDMMENISYTAIATPVPAVTITPEPTAEPTPEPTAEPTPEPTAEPTAEPTPTPTPTEAPIAAIATSIPATPAPSPLPRLAETKAVLLPILLSLAAAVMLFLVMFAIKKLVSAKLPVIVGILVPILAGAVLCTGLYRAASLNKSQAAEADAFDEWLAVEAARTPEPTFTPVPTAEPTPEPTAEPTPVPTAEPAPEPTPEPTPAPTAEPDPDNGRFTNGEEVVETDAEAGKWVYRNSTLSIEITQYTGISSKMEFPYYVADIYMRADEFRTGFGHESRNGMTSEEAIKIARRYKAVLLITGDNIKNMDIDKKGVLIRDGYPYNNGKKADVMVWHPENMTIELIPKENIVSAQNIAEDGVENAISFGPILVKDGVKTDKKVLEKNWLHTTNPRVGVGMMEPGHFIVVVGGYRSDNPKANLGWNLTEFADLMESLGCQQAYNVDGGVSAAMIFMGERLNRGGSKKDWSKLRNLPDGIIFGYSASVPE